MIIKSLENGNKREYSTLAEYYTDFKGDSPVKALKKIKTIELCRKYEGWKNTVSSVMS